MEYKDSAVVNNSYGHASLVGIGICPKCNIINKILSNDIIEGNKCRCHSCGTEIIVDKWLKK